ncbi:MAG: ABC transporter permease [Clostridia bacterium]|nr:ABC transporter permease [Clostridia bacterium]
MLNPILASSARRRMRAPRTMIVWSAYALALLLIALFMQSRFLGGQVYLARMNGVITLYAMLVGTQFALLLLTAPLMTAGAIASERERRTLELLLVTNTGSVRIVFGKLMECFAYLTLLVAGGLPTMCVVLLFGGITLPEILTAECFLLMVALGVASIGVFCSSFAKSTVSAAIFAFLMMLVIGAASALPLLNGYTQKVTDVLYDQQRYVAMSPVEALRWISVPVCLNPVIGLISLLEAHTGLFHFLTDRGWGRILATYMLMDKAGFIRVALLNGGAVAVIGLTLTLLGAMIIRPHRRVRRSKKK